MQSLIWIGLGLRPWKVLSQPIGVPLSTPPSAEGEEQETEKLCRICFEANLEPTKGQPLANRVVAPPCHPEHFAHLGCLLRAYFLEPDCCPFSFCNKPVDAADLVISAQLQPQVGENEATRRKRIQRLFKIHVDDSFLTLGRAIQETILSEHYWGSDDLFSPASGEVTPRETARTELRDLIGDPWANESIVRDRLLLDLYLGGLYMKPLDDELKPSLHRRGNVFTRKRAPYEAGKDGTDVGKDMYKEAQAINPKLQPASRWMLRPEDPSGLPAQSGQYGYGGETSTCWTAVHLQPTWFSQQIAKSPTPTTPIRYRRTPFPRGVLPKSTRVRYIMTPLFSGLSEGVILPLSVLKDSAPSTSWG